MKSKMTNPAGLVARRQEQEANGDVTSGQEGVRPCADEPPVPTSTSYLSLPVGISTLRCRTTKHSWLAELLHSSIITPTPLHSPALTLHVLLFPLLSHLLLLCHYRAQENAPAVMVRTVLYYCVFYFCATTELKRMHQQSWYV